MQHFRILITRCRYNYSISTQIEVYCNSPSQVFIFFSPLLKRISFYRRLTKIVPHKIPHSIIQELDSIFEYVDFNDSKKFSLLTNLAHFIKNLTIERMIDQSFFHCTKKKQMKWHTSMFSLKKYWFYIKSTPRNSLSFNLLYN